MYDFTNDILFETTILKAYIIYIIYVYIYIYIYIYIYMCVILMLVLEII